MDAQVMQPTKKGYCRFFDDNIYEWYSVLQVFLVTGGYFSVTTEILHNKNWKVLTNGNLPVPVSVTGVYGLNCETIQNEDM